MSLELLQACIRETERARLNLSTTSEEVEEGLVRLHDILHKRLARQVGAIVDGFTSSNKADVLVEKWVSRET